MNHHRNEHNSTAACCYYHPKEEVVGVCAICLRERLLNLLATSKQGHRHISKDSTSRSFRFLRRRPAIAAIPKVFALGSLLHRLDSRRQRPDEGPARGSIDSLDDSFISIKFENNGKASWESKKKESSDHPSREMELKGKSVVEHVKPMAVLRWRKRFGQLLHLSRWKRSNKAAAAHVGLVGKVDGRRRGWMRSLTRRRATN